MRTVFITGVRAKTGGPLAALLSQQSGIQVRGGSSNPSRVNFPGVDPVPFSWDDTSAWSAAMRDIDAVFVVRPDREDAPQLIAELLSLSSARTHVVLLSEIDGGYFAQDAWAPRVERAVQDSGRTWTILRPGWFMQIFNDPRFLLNDLIEHGHLPFPSNYQSVSWIDTRDIAAVAARALTDAGHEGSIYELTGPEALTFPRTANLLSEAVGHPVRHIEVSMEEALADSEGFARQNDRGAFDRVRLGFVNHVTETVERVTGRPARSLDTFIADNQPFRQT